MPAVFSAQSLGLHEVHGNVWEWCLERYHPEAYARGAEEKAAGSDEVPDSRVARGGSFSSAAFSARSASRNDFTPSYAGSTLGVRPVRLLTD